MSKLSISNIAWTKEQDDEVLALLQKYGYTGLEIAPTRVFPDTPYARKAEAAEWSGDLKKTWGLSVSSMQSIWYGRSERLFGSKAERQVLLDYTRQAIDFAAAMGCPNLVFGSPKNRCLPVPAEGETEEEGKCFREMAVSFFRELGEYASGQGTVLSMEANPSLYGTNFINTTREALDLIDEVDSPGFLLNLDVGTMLANGEDAEVLKGREHRIHHVHISEPGLKKIEKRELHRELEKILSDCGYDGYVSIEMGKNEGAALKGVEEAMTYVKTVFADL